MKTQHVKIFELQLKQCLEGNLNAFIRKVKISTQCPKFPHQEAKKKGKSNKTQNIWEE